MTKLENKYERMDAIERLLARAPRGLTSGELARELEVDPSTIFRDIAFLERRGTGLIQEGRRYLLDHRRSLATIKLTNDELLALYLAARLLSRHSDEHNPHVVRALEKLADALRVRSPLIAAHMDMAASAVRARRPHPAYVEALEALTQGWAEGRAVWLRYRNAEGRASERIFSPYFIEPSSIGYSCYAIGWDSATKKVITVKIERIAEARVTDERFTVPDSFSPLKMLANAWGVIYREEGSTEVVLHFSASVTRRVKESIWHHSQSIQDLPDGSCRFVVQVGSTLEMRPWIRQWGADVVVLAPPELRAVIAHEARRSAAAYAEESQ